MVCTHVVYPEQGSETKARYAPPNLTGDAPVAKKVPNPIDLHVGSRVRIRRLEFGMSQGKLGDALGITFQQVQKYERGTNRIGASRLQHISSILQVAVSYFFDGAPGQQNTKVKAPSLAYVSDFVTSTDGVALVKAFTKIKNANVRHQIVKLVNEIAAE
jgi:transcriptional regulator with XRE-family HTH domain